MSTELDRLQIAVDDLTRRMDKLTPTGKRGTGACICPASPAMRLRNMERMQEPITGRYDQFNDPILDHRCPEHGEKAQPALWGRHKEHQLRVKFAEWESLGVSYVVPAGTTSE